MTTVPRPANLPQALGWWLAYGLSRFHMALCRWHLGQAERWKERCPWFTWTKS